MKTEQLKKLPVALEKGEWHLLSVVDTKNVVEHRLFMLFIRDGLFKVLFEVTCVWERVESMLGFVKSHAVFETIQNLKINIHIESVLEDSIELRG